MPLGLNRGAIHAAVNQTAVFAGQPRMSRRCCLTLDLVNDAALIAEYEAYHAPGAAWPEVVADIRASGIESMEIWRMDERCMMIIEVTDDYPRAQVGPTSEIVARWNTLMARYQKPLPGAPVGVRWAPMKRIYRLDDASQITGTL
jgi:L-rhamnose mutarotase